MGGCGKVLKSTSEGHVFYKAQAEVYFKTCLHRFQYTSCEFTAFVSLYSNETAIKPHKSKEFWVEANTTASLEIIKVYLFCYTYDTCTPFVFSGLFRSSAGGCFL